MKELLKKILQRFGVTATEADKLLAGVGDGAAPEGATVESVVDPAMVQLRASLASNSDFMGPLEIAMKGKVRDQVDAKLRKVLELDDATYKALEQKGRTDKLVEMVNERIKAKAESGDDKEATIRDLNKQLRERLAEVKKLREEELPAALSAGEKAREKVMIEREAERILAAGDGLTVEMEFALPAVLAKLYADHEVALVNGKPQLRKPGTTSAAHDENHQEVTFAARIEAIAEAGKIRRKNGGKPDAPKKDDREEREASGTNLPPGLQKAQERAKALKEEAAKRKAEA